MGEEAWSLKNEATTFTATDTFCMYTPAEPVARLKVKQIKLRNLFGYTSGMTTTINYGIGEQAGYNAYFYLAATNINIGMQRGDGATGLIGTTATRCRFGSVTAHDVGINTNSSVRIIINATTGVITTLPTWSKDLAGGTLRTVVVDNTGQLGYNSSTGRAKTEIEDLPAGGTDFLKGLVVKQYERPGYPGQKEIGLIAEEVDQVPGVPFGLVTHETYIVEGETLKPITNDLFEEPLEVKKVIEKGNLEKKSVWKIKSRYTTLTKEEAAQGHDIGDVKEKELVEIEVKRVPETVEETRLIIPMLAEMQKLRAELDETKKTLDGAMAKIAILEKK